MSLNPDSVLTMILGGGMGKRLYPLTKFRSKPAVPVAGKFRLIDVPISNCLHAGLNRIFILTQFNSVSLHRHVEETYKFDTFGRRFIQILAAQQTLESSEWYQGTADAVRQNLRYVLSSRNKSILILSGDHLYRMDFRDMLANHEDTGADVTIATLPVKREQASGYGILKADMDGVISRFVEKPSGSELLDELEVPQGAFKRRGLTSVEGSHLASMGIYIFRKEVLAEALEGSHLDDFGGDIIPAALDRFKVQAYYFNDYWEDIGTIRTFYEANLKLLDEVPAFNFYDELRPIYTRPRYLPGVKVGKCEVISSILSDGSIVEKCLRIERSIIGIRTIVREGSEIRSSVIMGADFYSEDEKAGTMIGIGRGCRIEGAIIDKNARIGDEVVINPAEGREDTEEAQYSVREGVVIVPKNAIIPAGTVI